MIGHLRMVIIGHISIHAPLLQGVTCSTEPGVTKLAISIHAPVMGAKITVQLGSDLAEFQSTHP